MNIRAGQIRELELPLLRSQLSPVFALEDVLQVQLNCEAARPGLLLRAGYWDQAHELSDSLDEYYWHAIAHRMEPDEWNAGYWFRKVGPHAIFPKLRDEAAALVEQSGIGWVIPSEWDPFLFLKHFEQARKSDNQAAQAVCTSIQSTEWRLLFAYSNRD